jgi:hypothetical protein
MRANASSDFTIRNLNYCSAKKETLHRAKRIAYGCGIGGRNFRILLTIGRPAPILMSFIGWQHGIRARAATLKLPFPAMRKTRAQTFDWRP